MMLPFLRNRFNSIEGYTHLNTARDLVSFEFSALALATCLVDTLTTFRAPEVSSGIYLFEITRSRLNSNEKPLYWEALLYTKTVKKNS